MVLLDDLDRRILDALQTDCGLTNQTLSERVLTSPATCLRRVKRLDDVGVIERRIAILAPEAVRAGKTIGITAIVEVTLERQTVESQAAFEQRAIGEAEVQQCYRVTPGPDFVLIAYISDTEAYQALAARLFTGDAHVRNVRTYFATSRAKFAPRIPLSPAPDGR